MVKIFAHRGYAKNLEQQNTIYSVKEAVKAGYDGVEIDIHYHNNCLLVTHDAINKDAANNFENFHDFVNFKNELYYWLDFKNLQDLNDADLQSSLNILKSDILKSGVSLERFYFAPYITDYKTAARICNKFRDIFSQKLKIMFVVDDVAGDEIRNLKAFLDEKKIDCVSIKHNLVNEKLVENLKGINLFAWTVNDPEIAKNLIKNFKIANFTTDNILPTDLT